MRSRKIFSTDTEQLSAVPKLAWAAVVLILIFGAPLWMHWTEPKLFLALNSEFQVFPAVFWAFLSLMVAGYCLIAWSSIFLILSPRIFMGWLCSIPFLVIFSRLGKTLLLSPRPVEALGVQHVHIIGEPLFYHSMPSGHTTAAFAMAGAIFFSVVTRSRWRYSWIFLIAIFCGLSRIAVGAHWPGDVAVGSAAGLASAALGQYLLVRLDVGRIYDHMGFRLLVSLVMLSCIVKLFYVPIESDVVFTSQRIIAVVSIVFTLLFVFQKRGRLNASGLLN